MMRHAGAGGKRGGCVAFVRQSPMLPGKVSQWPCGMQMQLRHAYCKTFMLLVAHMHVAVPVQQPPRDCALCCSDEETTHVQTHQRASYSYRQTPRLRKENGNTKQLASFCRSGRSFAPGYMCSYGHSFPCASHSSRISLSCLRFSSGAITLRGPTFLNCSAASPSCRNMCDIAGDAGHSSVLRAYLIQEAVLAVLAASAGPL